MMEPPSGFSWVDRPHLAALARPGCAEDLVWLREQGIEVLLSLTEDPPRRHWINDAGLMASHVPVEDMTAPTPEQLDQCLDTIRRANDQGLGVAVHCGAGLGRTGVVLACYFVAQGLPAAKAIARVRKLRPGSIETPEQEEAIAEYARRIKTG
jgi:atypical dual specificity phosphatase